MSAEQSNYGAFVLLLSNKFVPNLSNRFRIDHVRVLWMDRHMFLRPQSVPHMAFGLIDDETFLRPQPVSHRELGLNCYI